MRHNPDFALDDVDAIREMVRHNPWATIVSFIPGRGLVASHYPMLLDEDATGIVLLSHVGRPDERLHELGRHEAMVVVYGPQGYISPGWYEVPTAVPTWNFEVAHLHGTPEILSDEKNLEVLDRLVAHFEDQLPEPFLMRGTLENAQYAEHIVRGTVGFRMVVDRFEAKQKMSQNKPPQMVEHIIGELRRPGPFQNPSLADHMARIHRT
ncbi:MAG: FMN-binding negative transcriptional regulator [Microbacterium sp.]